VIKEFGEGKIYDDRKFDPIELTTSEIESLIEETLPKETV